MVEVLETGLQAETFLRAFPPLESLLLSFLTPCRTVRLLNDVVAAGRPDDLLMVNALQAWNPRNGAAP